MDRIALAVAVASMNLVRLHVPRACDAMWCLPSFPAQAGPGSKPQPSSRDLAPSSYQLPASSAAATRSASFDPPYASPGAPSSFSCRPCVDP